jgi:hypothetical protein
MVPSAGLPTHSGELTLTVADAQYGSVSDVQLLVNAITGKTPSGDRYVSIDESGNVVASHIADPACGDTAPGSHTSLVLDDKAAPGDLLFGGSKLLPNTPVSPQRAPLTGRQIRRRLLANQQPLP